MTSLESRLTQLPLPIPWAVRALDAVELMNVGVNIREHAVPEARVHYAV